MKMTKPSTATTPSDEMAMVQRQFHAKPYLPTTTRMAEKMSEPSTVERPSLSGSTLAQSWDMGAPGVVLALEDVGDEAEGAVCHMTRFWGKFQNMAAHSVKGVRGVFFSTTTNMVMKTTKTHGTRQMPKT